MKNKTYFAGVGIITVLFMAALLVITPALAADSDTIVIITTTINADGTGKNRWEVNGELLEREESSTTIEQVCNEVGSDVFTTNRLERRGGVQWCVLEGRFDDLDQLGGDFYHEFNISVNQLEFKRNTLYYDIEFDPNIDSSSVNVEWKIIAPGKVVDHNADKVSGCSLSWTLDATGSTNIQLQSKTDEGCSRGLVSGLGRTTAYILAFVVFCCCLLLVVVAGVVVFFVMRKTKKQGA